MTHITPVQIVFVNYRDVEQAIPFWINKLQAAIQDKVKEYVGEDVALFGYWVGGPRTKVVLVMPQLPVGCKPESTFPIAGWADIENSLAYVAIDTLYHPGGVIWIAHEISHLLGYPCHGEAPEYIPLKCPS